MPTERREDRRSLVGDPVGASGGGEQRHPYRCRPRRSPEPRASRNLNVGAAACFHQEQHVGVNPLDQSARLSLDFLGHGTINE